jgi:hypothetical protein
VTGSTRRSLLAGLLLACGACVLPVAPEFEEEKNLPPYLISAMPQVASLTVKDPFFTVSVQDPNEHDTLHVRWVIDYPPYDGNSTRLRESDVASNAATLDFKPNCRLHQISGVLTRHRLMVLVADRPFLSTDMSRDRPFEVTPPGSYPLTVAWQFDLDCNE